MTDTAGRIPEQIELFLPYLADLPLRHQREMMERPFFSLAKSKRVKPIDYRSPDGKLWVNVSANPAYGMATIWDADVLIYCASLLVDLVRRGQNDIPRKLHLMPYDLLRGIGRPTTGRAYELLGQAMDRLVATTVKTNIRAENRREATFSWLDGWSQLVDEKTERSRGMTIELSSWFYEGVLMAGGVLAIDRAYFDISGGRERWLYNVARKHAGGAGETGFAISLPTLFEKSGAEGLYRRFKFEIAKIVERNELPGYSLELERTSNRAEPALRMRRRTEDDGKQARSQKHLASPLVGRHSLSVAPSAASGSLPRSRQNAGDFGRHGASGDVTAATLALLRSECPGWDYEVLHADFRAWIDADVSRTPVNYQQAFIGFVRRHHARNRHALSP
jgi:plasmid replication initiation protein